MTISIDQLYEWMKNNRPQRGSGNAVRAANALTQHFRREGIDPNTIDVAALNGADLIRMKNMGRQCTAAVLQAVSVLSDGICHSCGQRLPKTATNVDRMLEHTNQ